MISGMLFYLPRSLKKIAVFLQKCLYRLINAYFLQFFRIETWAKFIDKCVLKCGLIWVECKH